MLTYASFVNIPNVQVLFFDQANAYDVVAGNHWLVFQKDMDSFKEMVSKWIKINYYDIIRGPIITEKASKLLNSLKKITFLSSSRST